MVTEKDDTEFIVIPRNENCKSDKMTIFVGVIYAYKGLLLVSKFLKKYNKKEKLMLSI